MPKLKKKTMIVEVAIGYQKQRWRNRAKHAEPEFVDVAAMWSNVIADCRCRYDSALKAQAAKRLNPELM